MLKLKIETKGLDGLESKVKRADYLIKELKKVLAEIRNSDVTINIKTK